MQFHKDKKENSLLNDVLKITETRNASIIKNEKQAKDGTTKNYYSYQIQIPINFLNLIYEQEKNFYYHIINPQLIEINTTPAESEALKLKYGLQDSENFNKKNPLASYTLPKKYFEYLQAFDTYQDVLNNINNDLPAKKKFDLQPLKIKTCLEVSINNKRVEFPTRTRSAKIIAPENYLEYKLYVELSAEVDDALINYIKVHNEDGGGVPSWLEVLIIDWNNKTLRKHFE